MYIRSSPRGPNRDPDRTLSNELLLLIKNINFLPTKFVIIILYNGYKRYINIKMAAKRLN